MKKNYLRGLILGLVTLLPIGLQAQSVVQVGSGSYASFPPASENIDWNNDGIGDLYPFVFDKPIYVAPNRANSPIPTNDWWTDLVISGKDCGMLWAYPLSVDPDATGVKMYFANSFVTDGSNLNYGGYMHIGAANYAPTKGFAKDWSDWGLVMSLNDSINNKNMDITMAHGVPYMWLQTQGLNPEFKFDRSASYLNADGSAVSFPTSNSFVVQTDGRHFGIHLPGNTTAEIQGQQFVSIDLGSVQSISKVKMRWETAYAKGYSLSVSNDNVTYTPITTITNGDGNYDSLTFSSSGRYIKIGLIEKGTIYGYSLYEVQAFNGTTLLSQGKTVTVSSTQPTGAFFATNITDGSFDTRWASDAAATEKLVINTNSGNSYFVVSALPNASALTSYETEAFNRVTNTQVTWNYNIGAGTVGTTWAITTSNLKGLSNGNTRQGFLPHMYMGATNSVSFTSNDYLSPRGTLKTAIGNSYSFTYKFGGILPNFTSPYKNTANSSPYDANVMYDLLTKFSKKTGYGGDTYWGGKDLVNFAKYTLMAKELNHQAYDALKVKTREALVNWLTYTPGENEKFFAKYDRWKAIIGFNESFGSNQFTDNHFHYGYLIHAAALYGQVDPDFITQYGGMLTLITKQYANYDRADTTLPFLRTFDPWIGHSYAGGTSSSSGNNQESTSEAMQAWIGMFLLGDVMGDANMRAAAAFGYAAESNATLEYWFDWKERNLPPAYAHNVVGILSNQGFAYGTYFSASPVHIHGIQYLPVSPGFKYLAIDSTWAAREYSDMTTEATAVDGHQSELDYGDDWAHVALGFRQLYDPGYVANFMKTNLALGASNAKYIMDYEVAGMTYYYTHARQNLGKYSNTFRTSFPSSSVFENASGGFAYAVAYNPSSSAQVCTVYNGSGTSIATFTVPARTLITYPTLPTTGQQPVGCYGLLPLRANATSGNAAAAIDGSNGTRWESQFTDPQTITVDLGLPSTVNAITLSWEVANAKKYKLYGSLDSTNWVLIDSFYNTTTGNRTDYIDSINGLFRYVKMLGLQRNTPYGYSIYEFSVCGTAVPPATGVTLPALIQAEAYTDSSGIQTEATNDMDGGRNVGYIDPGDWLEYKVNTPITKTYQVKLRVSNAGNASTVNIKSNGSLLSTATIPSTGGWQTWTTVLDTITLAAGNHTIRLEANTLKFNINWLEITNPVTTLHIEAESYSSQSGVLTENTADFGGGLNVGYIDNSDYMNYSVNVPTAGTYTVKYRVASPNSTGSIQLKQGSNVLSTKAVPQTGGYQTWQTISTTAAFAAGTNTYQIFANVGGFNINWWEIIIPSSLGRRAITSENSVYEGVVVPKLSIYPNPASGSVIINLPQAANMRLTTLAGKQIKNAELAIGDNLIDISDLASGIYLVYINQKPYKLLVESRK